MNSPLSKILQIRKCSPLECEYCTIEDSRSGSCSYDSHLIGQSGISFLVIPLHASCRYSLVQNSSPSYSMEVGIETDPSSGNQVPYVRSAASSQSQAKCTTEDHGPLGKPNYEKRDDPSLRGPVQKRY